MAVGSVTLECPVAVSVELLWKVVFTGDVSIFTKACVGMIDAVEVDGDGGPGSVTTMKLNPAVGDAKVFKTRLLSRDTAARVVKSEMVFKGGELDGQFKSQVSEVKVVPAGEGASVVHMTVEYERVDGALLPPENEARIGQGYLSLIKKVEEYLVAHPGEFA
ncbi:major allergen Api g 1, isoallergen 1-like [Panicum miliaceum]|uniref:Major allergen Api g 1, isoallergen 1-like n=1 Tax=Panicum miliaceum TaxID=4540 RepID=A0A3L6T584_PANMI|nr:major allergen Api g 1, isoallergen 1-like [Panicum miliaceum]